jgi:hypothetical protein
VSDFQIVPDAIRETLKSPRLNSPRPEVIALLDGKTIFLPEIRARDGLLPNLRTAVIRRSEGLKTISSRSTSVDGVPGIVVWAVDKAVQP